MLSITFIKEYPQKCGEILEVYIKKKLEEKNFKYQSGHYSIDTPETKGECDIVLETKNEIIFLEVKKRGFQILLS